MKQSERDSTEEPIINARLLFPFVWQDGTTHFAWVQVGSESL